MEIVQSLRRLEFPVSCEQALHHYGLYLQQNSSSIPGLGQSNLSKATDIAEEFIFHSSAKTSKHLNAVMQLQVLELVVDFFNKQQNEGFRNMLFSSMFGGKNNEHKLTFLSKLVSMALGLKNKAILDCAAQWMQDQGHNSQGSCLVVRTLVQDYCMLVPGSLTIIAALPKLSQHFTCNFMSTLTVLYSPIVNVDHDRPVVPQQLLQLITDWILENHKLCLCSLQFPTRSQAPSSTLWTKPVLHTPLPGLITWCVLAPLLYQIQLTTTKSAGKLGSAASASKSGQTEGDDHHKIQSVFSQLHLGLLHTLMSFMNVSQPQPNKILSVQDMVSIAQIIHTSITQIPQHHESPAVQTAVDRLAQFLQVAIATRAIKCHKDDLNRICHFLPNNKLIDIIRRHHSF